MTLWIHTLHGQQKFTTVELKMLLQSSEFEN